MIVELPLTLGCVPLKTRMGGCLFHYDFGTMYDMDLNIECGALQVKLWLFWSDSPGDTKTEEIIAFSQEEVNQALQKLFEIAQKLLLEKLALEQWRIRDLQVKVDQIEESLRLMAGKGHPTLWDRLEDYDANG
jgi:hypothetical protein